MDFMKFKADETELSANLIPLINVIFVILIFFLVLYRFSTIDVGDKDDAVENKEEDNNIDLSSGISNALEMKNTLIIEISESNKIFINGNHTGNNMPAMKEIIINPEETKCIIRIHKDATYRGIGTLLINLKRIGISKISFKTIS